MKSWNEAENPLGQVCETWLKKIDLALEAKEALFGRYAEEAMKFYDGDHCWMWDNQYAKGPNGFLSKSGILPTFRMSVNRVAELVSMFIPTLYNRNPTIQATPIDPPQLPPEVFGMNFNVPMPPDPMAAMQLQQQMQQFQMMQMQEQSKTAIRHAHASLFGHYLNWLQREADKKTQHRRALVEALVMGMGLVQTVMHRPDGSQIQYPVSKYLSCRDFVVDPDARYWEDVQWIAIWCEHPTYQAEDEYGLERGSLKGHSQSKESQAHSHAKGKGKSKERDNGRPKDNTLDLIGYWKIYSKCGIGDKLKGMDNEDREGEMDFLGDFCFLAVARGIPYPLNIPNEVSRPPQIDPAMMAAMAMDPSMPDPMQEYEDALIQAAQWPIPFWRVKDGWPVSRVYFYDKPQEVWPVSIIKTAIGELRFINWGMSFLADKAAASSTTYLGVLKAAANEIKEQIAKNPAGPFSLLEVPDVLAVGADLNKIISFLDAPEFGEELYNVIAKVSENFDKRTGLMDLLYGLQSTQPRSATEMQVKDQNVSVRPDDMASQVEDWLSVVALRELQAARWMCMGPDMVGPLGELGAWVWDNQILTTDLEYVERGFTVRVESGSARKPNKTNRVSQLNEIGQFLMPALQGFAQGGNVQPFNGYVTEMCKAMDMDASPFMLPAMPPPPPPGQEQEPPPPK